jgi:hypothetical protein
LPPADRAEQSGLPRFSPEFSQYNLLRPNRNTTFIGNQQNFCWIMKQRTEELPFNLREAESAICFWPIDAGDHFANRKGAIRGKMALFRVYRLYCGLDFDLRMSRIMQQNSDGATGEPGFC